MSTLRRRQRQTKPGKKVGKLKRDDIRRQPSSVDEPGCQPRWLPECVKGGDRGSVVVARLSELSQTISFSMEESYRSSKCVFSRNNDARGAFSTSLKITQRKESEDVNNAQSYSRLVRGTIKFKM